MPRRLRYLVFFLVIFTVTALLVSVFRKSARQKSDTRFVDQPRFQHKDINRLLQAEVGGYRKIHVFVALCDNKLPGVIKVPPSIGNGQDPSGNLYWGARYGVKTFFTRDPNWRLIGDLHKPFPHLLERLIFRHATAKVYLVADAYDGRYIKDPMEAAVLSSAGMLPEPITITGQTYVFGGGADLLTYVGHNALAAYPPDQTVQRQNARHRDAIFLCCVSRPCFEPLLKQAGAYPLLMTTQSMCPEAYTLSAALDGWARRQSPERIHERAAQEYSHYQKCSVKAAKRLLVTGYSR